ncbi:50S ribosomal protein L11 methyltransferase [Limosilactobacillus fermentum]|uniref:50S ribosomal protein L11 methyltransferase n=1 Tax=Limosilactobacillus fermentum TaxID=1613 RepID=UPI0021A7A28F|nr:50S ribosomal protein L11 methyltransferase [Limosilactobacillus fermentum]MCT3461641.1 50S ribosomal protein L11 methyltransferase [Limosilactobacillus fermentum]
MNWTAIVVETSTEAVDAVSYILTDTGATGVKIDDAADYQKLKPGKYGPYGEIVDPSTLPHREEGAAVTGYYPPTTFVPEKIADIRQRVAKLADFGLNPAPARVAAEEIDNQDWATAWQKYYHPVRVTRELTIVPRWEEYTPATADEKLLVLDPGMAFGTGTHPTTQLMLQALTIALRGGESMIDVGTGSGVLSIAAKQLGAGEVWAYDIDDVAVKSAEKNLALNPIAKDVHTGVNSLLDGIHTQVDLVVANILAEIILPLVPQAFENLKPGGKFLTSGIINTKFETVKKAIEAQGFVVDETMRIKDWYGIIAHKPAPEEA